VQITLNQSEIEQALKNYILEQININEGMEINIDLKATRGDQGTTAIIDILPIGTVAAPAPVVQEQAAAPAPAGRQPRQPRAAKQETPVEQPAAVETVAKNEAEPLPAEVEEQEEEEEEGEVVLHSDEPSAVEAAIEAKNNGPAVDAEATATAETEAVVQAEPAKPSLFAGLRRPDNNMPS
jgi:outer membrane biosynthesis protein TonB